MPLHCSGVGPYAEAMLGAGEAGRLGASLHVIVALKPDAVTLESVLNVTRPVLHGFEMLWPCLAPEKLPKRCPPLPLPSYTSTKS